jgi:hypothetical protein
LECPLLAVGSTGHCNTARSLSAGAPAPEIVWPVDIFPEFFLEYLIQSQFDLIARGQWMAVGTAKYGFAV